MTVQDLESKLKAANRKTTRILLSEISPEKLVLFDHIDWLIFCIFFFGLWSLYFLIFLFY